MTRAETAPAGRVPGTGLVMALALAAATMLAPPMGQGALAQTGVAVETVRIDSLVATLHLHPFLREDELSILRGMASLPEVLAAFAGGGGGFAALAVSPVEGFLRDGLPTNSAIAMAQFADIATARATVVAACTEASATRAPCVVVLEVAPMRQ